MCIHMYVRKKLRKTESKMKIVVLIVSYNKSKVSYYPPFVRVWHKKLLIRLYQVLDTLSI